MPNQPKEQATDTEPMTPLKHTTFEDGSIVVYYQPGQRTEAEARLLELHKCT